MLLFFLVFLRFLYIFTFDTNLEGVEFALIHFIQKINSTGTLYTNVEQFPFLLVVHAPLYYFLMSGLASLFRIDVLQDVHQLYILCRSFSFLLLFLDIYLLLRLVKSLAPEFSYKIYLVLVFVLFLPGHFYSCRPDSLKVSLFFVFFYFLLKFHQQKKWKFQWIAIITLVIATCTKQDVLVYGLCAYGIFFLIERKLSYLYAALIVLCLIFGLVLGYYLCSDINLFKVLFYYNLQYDSKVDFKIFLVSSYFIRVLPFLIFTFFNSRSNNLQTRIIAVISLMFLLLCSIEMMRTGASVNYIYESVILFLLNGVLFVKEQNTPLNELLFGRFQPLMFVYILLHLLFINLSYYSLYFRIKDELKFRNDYVQNMKNARTMKEYIDTSVLFIPDMKYYIFYPDSKLIYGADWHYDRYCEIALDIRIKPKYINNPVVQKYDKQFENGVVHYILIENTARSLSLLKKYYTHFSFYKKVDNMLLYKFDENHDE
ncbi:MAG: hypothetical protein KDD21_03130 [Bacteroidetes bacterium]|nr:hypothetical protein [Bacteroidota bacterium]